MSVVVLCFSGMLFAESKDVVPAIGVVYLAWIAPVVMVDKFPGDVLFAVFPSAFFAS